MVFYAEETMLGLCIASLPALASIYFYFIAEKKGIALFLLLVSSFLIRILMISLDPYLHEWDEKFHALVAKNMISFPFKPMLFQHHVFTYDYKDWSYNHIWLNKQPLFLWQMALSMKVFGVNLFALRLPSAIMGTVMVWLIYDLARSWILNDSIAFVAGFIACFSYWSLELIAGAMSTDHNDLAFLFYVTCSFWAFSRYVHNGMKLKWAIAIGVFAGLAVLNKWLPGMLVYLGWAVYLVTSMELRKDLIQLFISVVVALIIFVPWQIYILHSFPLESTFVYNYNRIHMTENLGHPGTIFYHILFLPEAYNFVFLAFLIFGFIAILFSKTINTKLTISFLVMVIALFSFFSLLVKTKMASLPYPVAGLMMILSAYGMVVLVEFFTKKYGWQSTIKNYILAITVLITGVFALKPWTIAHNRSIDNEKRNNKIYNTWIYQHFNTELYINYVIINCRQYENIDLMYYTGVTAYHYYPDLQEIESRINQGFQFASFDYKDFQELPYYYKDHQEIRILDYELK